MTLCEQAATDSNDCAVAWDFAAMYPDMVEKLAALSVVPGKLFARNMDMHQILKCGPASRVIWNDASVRGDTLCVRYLV